MSLKHAYLMRLLSSRNAIGYGSFNRYALVAAVNGNLNKSYTTVSSSKKGQSITISNLNELTPEEKPKLDFSFEDSKTAFKSKSNFELLRGYLVFQLCSFNFIVENQKTIMNLTRKILGKKLFSDLMRMTFYGHFVAGEDQQGIKGNVEKMMKYGVKSILDYSAEEDLVSDVKTSHAVDELDQSKKHFHPMEVQFDKNKKIFLDCIDAVSDVTSSTGIGAVKLTSLVRPALLLKLSSLCNQLNNSPNVDKNHFNWKALIDKSDEEFAKTFNQIQDLQVNGKQEKVEFTASELGELRNLFLRIDQIVEHAVSKNVRLFVDAEQTYFQDAIHRFTLEAMRYFNKNKCVILHTYQNYLKSAFNTLKKDIKQSQDEGIYFGAKLVRGAYMEQERERAKEHGYEDPINESYEKTTEMYEKSLVYCLDEIKRNPLGRISVMVASHNEDTVRFAVEKMQEYNIKPSDRIVCFGQLLGMCDYISFYLGGVGYSVYKYVPYGPIEEVLPYLSRRANENRGIFDKVKKEKRLIVNELKRRMLFSQ